MNHPILWYILWRYTPTRASLLRLHDHTQLRHTHKHTVGILWSRDLPIAETSTWQSKTYKKHRHPCPGGFRYDKIWNIGNVYKTTNAEIKHIQFHVCVCFDVTKLFPDVPTVNTLQFKQHGLSQLCVSSQCISSFYSLNCMWPCTSLNRYFDRRQI